MIKVRLHVLPPAHSIGLHTALSIRIRISHLRLHPVLSIGLRINLLGLHPALTISFYPALSMVLRIRPLPLQPALSIGGRGRTESVNHFITSCIGVGGVQSVPALA